MDKNAVQAKHIRKVGPQVLLHDLHRIVMKVAQDYIRKMDGTEKTS